MNINKNYNGNLVELRIKREKILKKKHKLNLQIKKYSKMDKYERIAIFKDISKLSLQISLIEKEIEKIQTAMQNSGNWMDGDYNNNMNV